MLLRKKEVDSDLVGECDLLRPVKEKRFCIGNGIVPSAYFKLQGKWAVLRINPHSFVLSWRFSGNQIKKMSC